MKNKSAWGVSLQVFFDRRNAEPPAFVISIKRIKALPGGPIYTTPIRPRLGAFKKINPGLQWRVLFFHATKVGLVFKKVIFFFITPIVINKFITYL